MYNSMKTRCYEAVKCCYKDQYDRCMILTEALKNCRFAKKTPDSRPYRLGKKPVKKKVVDGWPYE